MYTLSTQDGTSELLTGVIEPAIVFDFSTDRQRSVSLQNGEFFSLRTIESHLNSSGRQKSLSFSGMSHVIDSILKTSSGEAVTIAARLVAPT